jgi:hypothetical protein
MFIRKNRMFMGVFVILYCTHRPDGGGAMHLCSQFSVN